MQRLGAAFALVSVAAAWPTPDKYKPMIEACTGMATMDNCTANMQGVCSTSENGERMCKHGCHHGHGDDHHKHGPFFKTLMKLKDHVFKTKSGPHHDFHIEAGDCEKKKDGESCTAPVEGKCIPTGKCPVFKGQTVCRPNNAHPPKFVTDACKGKKEGDDCKMMFMHGKCTKIKYFPDMTCKMSSPFDWHHHKEEKTESIVV